MIVDPMTQFSKHVDAKFFSIRKEDGRLVMFLTINLGNPPQDAIAFQGEHGEGDLEVSICELSGGTFHYNDTKDFDGHEATFRAENKSGTLTVNLFVLRGKVDEIVGQWQKAGVKEEMKCHGDGWLSLRKTWDVLNNLIHAAKPVQAGELEATQAFSMHALSWGYVTEGKPGSFTFRTKYFRDFRRSESVSVDFLGFPHGKESEMQFFKDENTVFSYDNFGDFKNMTLYFEGKNLSNKHPIVTFYDGPKEQANVRVIGSWVGSTEVPVINFHGTGQFQFFRE